MCIHYFISSEAIYNYHTVHTDVERFLHARRAIINRKIKFNSSRKEQFTILCFTITIFLFFTENQLISLKSIFLFGYENDYLKFSLFPPQLISLFVKYFSADNLFQVWWNISGLELGPCTGRSFFSFKFHEKLGPSSIWL